MSAFTATRPELIETLRNSRSLAIDNGKLIERCRYAYQEAGDLDKAGELVVVNHQLMAIVNALNGLLAAESEKVEAGS